MDYVAGVGFQVGLPEILLGLAVLGALLFVIWTIAKLAWSAFSG